MSGIMLFAGGAVFGSATAIIIMSLCFVARREDDLNERRKEITLN